MKSNRLLRRGPALALLVAGTLAASMVPNVEAQNKGAIENFTATAVNVTKVAKTIALDYSGAPVVLKDVKAQKSNSSAIHAN